MYTWGDCNNGKLGHGSNGVQYDTALEPKRILNVPKMKIMDISCGDNFTCFVNDYGEMLMAGKGSFEKNSPDDIELYSTPFKVLLELEIKKVFCGPNHVIALEHHGRCYALGAGEQGCLGLGDNKNRIKVC